MRISCLLAAMATLTAATAMGQTMVARHGFDTVSVPTTAGIAGKALDLSSAAATRRPVTFPYALGPHAGSYSVQVWVKTGEGPSRYTFLEATAGGNGWQLGIQENGAWFWELQQGKTTYRYQPTPQRQQIRDKRWHQLTFCHHVEKQEATLYFDGRQVAIYNIEGISKATAADTLFAGGRPQGDRSEWNTFPGQLDEVTLFDGVLSPASVAASWRRHFPLSPEKSLPAGKQLTVMNFNIWHGGNETGKDAGPARVVDIIRQSGADIVSMQETYGSGEKIADALGYYFYLRSSNLSIMSRFPIDSTLPGSRSFFNGGALVRLNEKSKVAFITNWLSYPFDYWAMLEKGEKLELDTLVAGMKTHNAAQLTATLDKLSPVIQRANEVPVIFCGDLNSGSHLDYVEKTKHLNGGLVVPFPQSIYMAEAGFTDSYRKVHPDPLKDRGTTWSPEFPSAFKDRIDYIYYKGSKLHPVKSFLIDRHPVKYPSDHAALITVFDWKP
ncbi:LamG-like jellyroll fold domain-containing protein [Chitinophaga caseinilytica]|uniref:Endonuclease/exonuclease/phosphatase family protein n=1 Tax=Chitinophaga caseinilytica TaxID=2267521 RepID=A0ABZ2ZA95_9BACT